MAFVRHKPQPNDTTHRHTIELKAIDRRMLDNLPAYATVGSAAVDLFASLDGYDGTTITLLPGESKLVPTGIAIHIGDPNLAALVLPRSSMGKRGLILANSVGLIDSDYQGELMVNLWNRSNSPQAFSDMDRIAQLLIVPVVHAAWKVVDEFSASTARGTGGHGSTGVRGSVAIKPSIDLIWPTLHTEDDESKPTTFTVLKERPAPANPRFEVDYGINYNYTRNQNAG